MDKSTGYSQNDKTIEDGQANLLHKKKERPVKVPTQKRNQRKTIEKISQKEEEKILRYAMKLSEMEYKEKNQSEGQSEDKPKLTIHDIEPCATIIATEEDFKNPIAFFDSIWNKEHSTGIIKIIPPKDWKSKNFELFKENYCKKFAGSDKKLDTRKIILNELYKAKVWFKFTIFNIFSFIILILMLFNSRLVITYNSYI